jgi:hypothetical protein
MASILIFLCILCIYLALERIAFVLEELACKMLSKEVTIRMKEPLNTLDSLLAMRVF